MRYNSTLIPKKKQLACGCFDYPFSKNRCKMHATIEDAQKRIQKKIAAEDCDDTLNDWFLARRKEMTGYCKHCGGKSSKDQNRYYKGSIAHILPKRLFKSVTTHPANWVELCFWGNSCHPNFDNQILDIMDLNCYDEVIEKFILMYPSIDKKERKYLPEVLMQYVESNI